MAKRRHKRQRINAALKSLPKSLRSAETDADKHARYRYGHREWPMVGVRELIDKATKLTGKTLATVRAAIHAIVMAARARAVDHVKALDELWNDVSALGWPHLAHRQPTGTEEKHGQIDPLRPMKLKTKSPKLKPPWTSIREAYSR